MTQTRKLATWLIPLLVPLAAAEHARAETICGSAPRLWNVPTGGVLVQKNAGIIETILNTVGEYYTHSAISYRTGVTDYVMHSTMGQPGMCFYLLHGVVPCTADLQNGQPGPSKLYVSAYHKFAYDGGLTAIGWADGGTVGANTAAWLYTPSGALTATSPSNGLSQYRWNGTDLHYRLDQYKDDGQVEVGGLPTTRPGMVCSTFIAFALNRATGGVISDRSYSGSSVALATGALRQVVKDQCHAEADWFSEILANCAGSADKVANCFHDNAKCGSVSEWYKGVQGQPAYSVSPDRLVGRGSNDGGGPWMNKAINAVTWSGSTLYGCWK